MNFKTWKETYKSKSGLLAAMHEDGGVMIDGRPFSLTANNHTQNEVNDFLKKEIGKSWMKASGVDFLIARRKKLGIGGKTTVVERLLTPLEYQNKQAEIFNLKEKAKGLERELKAHDDFVERLKAQGWTPPPRE